MGAVAFKSRRPDCRRASLTPSFRAWGFCSIVNCTRGLRLGLGTAVIVSWSGGKDSALLLHHLRRDPQYEVIGLVTTVTRDYDRITRHGNRRAILAAQATRPDLPLYQATIPAAASNAAYEAAFLAAPA